MEKPDICNVEKMKYEPLNNKDMKKLLGLITALYFGLASLNAMSYEEARDRARFLTDKMAYELNLNDQQNQPGLPDEYPDGKRRFECVSGIQKR